ncbi:MCE family protein [Saccharopolyspora gloriosae]|uniref:MCE family protein n=1 Tax=Saccharopolyspora gloriosae TaxID=455344 RepID=UPI001FB76019|nr:MCE family protein [Saccharopolyspora gloriosae]
MSSLAALRRRLLGLALLMVIVLAVAVCIGAYRGAFTRTVDVVLRAGSTGNQILPEADVKVRGMIVGQVREVAPADGGAEMRLALDPDKVDEIPANVTARLLPRTLFGERYVSLELPPERSARHLAAGDVIAQDRAKGSVELEQVLADTMPLLEAVHPQDLAVTLNGLNQALDGRGESLGETITALNRYVAELNPSVPRLQENLRHVVGVAETYEQAAPDVLRALSDVSTTARTLTEQRANLSAMTAQLTTTSNDLTGFLEANSQDLIRLNTASRPTLDVLAKYSPQYPCMFAQSAGIIPRVNELFGVGTDEPGAHVTLEITPNRGKYLPGEEPELGDERGPRCYDFEHAPQYPPDGPVHDGSDPPPAARTGTEGLLPGSTTPSSASSGGSAHDLGMANSPAERDLIAGILAPAPNAGGQAPPSWSSLLLGPVLRDTQVTVRPR